MRRSAKLEKRRHAKQIKREDLHPGDIVMFCKQRIPCETPFYDPHNATLHYYRMKKPGKGVVVHVTENNGVLLVVTKGPEDLKWHRHWLPLHQIVLNTGMKDSKLARSAEDFPWSEAYVLWQREQQHKRMRQEE